MISCCVQERGVANLPSRRRVLDSIALDLCGLGLLSLRACARRGLAFELALPIGARVTFSLDANFVTDVFDTRAALGNVLCHSLRGPLSHGSAERDFSITDFDFDLAGVEIGAVR